MFVREVKGKLKLSSRGSGKIKTGQYPTRNLGRYIFIVRSYKGICGLINLGYNSVYLPKKYIGKRVSFTVEVE